MQRLSDSAAWVRIVGKLLGEVDEDENYETVCKEADLYLKFYQSRFPPSEVSSVLCDSSAWVSFVCSIKDVCEEGTPKSHIANDADLLLEEYRKRFKQ